ncbi:hypothetical protein HC928_07825 [bacterium]|nr:hypothetical protein [bacterium]
MGTPILAENLKDLGVPEELADPLALGASLIRLPEKKGKTISKKAQQLSEPSAPPSSSPSESSGPLFPEESRMEISKKPSGLTKLRIEETEKPGLAKISEQRQKAVKEKLNKEASELVKKSIKKNLPISKQLEEGFDFEGAFRKGFSELENVAKKAPVDLNTEKMDDFFRPLVQKYAGISATHLSEDANKILKYIEDYYNRPFNNLPRALTVFRENNSK